MKAKIEEIKGHCMSGNMIEASTRLSDVLTYHNEKLTHCEQAIGEIRNLELRDIHDRLVEFQEELRAHMIEEATAHAKNLSALQALVKSVVPEGDIDGHRVHHEHEIIKRRVMFENRRELMMEAKKMGLRMFIPAVLGLLAIGLLVKLGIYKI